MKAWHGSRGVTLVELCFGLAVLAVLAGLAAPSFQVSLRVAAVRAATFELLAGLQQARASAILQSRPGSLCPSGVDGRCRAAMVRGEAWSGTGHMGGQALPRGVTLHASRSPLQFWPHSFSASPGTLTICDAQGLAPPRSVVVSITGRARVAAASPEACSP